MFGGGVLTGQERRSCCSTINAASTRVSGGKTVNGWCSARSSPDLCVKAEEAPRLRLGCLGDLLFLEE